MLRTKNLFMLDGRLTKDPELRYTAGGQAVASYTVAVNHVYFDEDRRVEETDFVPVSTLGKQAENDMKYLRKGSAVSVAGRIRSWFDAKTHTGGFRFRVSEVIYRGHAQGMGAAGVEGAEEKGRDEAPEAAHQAWLSEYDAASTSQ